MILTTNMVKDSKITELEAKIDEQQDDTKELFTVIAVDHDPNLEIVEGIVCQASNFIWDFSVISWDDTKDVARENAIKRDIKSDDSTAFWVLFRAVYFFDLESYLEWLDTV